MKLGLININILFDFLIVKEILIVIEKLDKVLMLISFDFIKSGWCWYE